MLILVKAVPIFDILLAALLAMVAAALVILVGTSKSDAEDRIWSVFPEQYPHGKDSEFSPTSDPEST